MEEKICPYFHFIATLNIIPKKGGRITGQLKHQSAPSGIQVGSNKERE